jgi:cobyrinic acid a,c-diamide synthase
MVIAGTHSGVGKTTVATGLMAALVARGNRVAAAKVGPDFIDPGYHRLATGRPGRNLDAWICGADAIAPLAARAGEGAGILVIEGVMGLFDGADEQTADGLSSSSTAQVAALLGAPVVLVVDASAMSGSVAALVHGFASYSPAVSVAGVICNKVGSDGHEAMLRSALEPLGIPVLGALHRDDSFAWRDRHLGLVPVVEQPTALSASIARLATSIERSCDLEAISALAASAAPLETSLLLRAAVQGAVRVAVAGGAAFSFLYRDNLERLEEAGGELVEFDPTVDESLPEAVDALYIGGGFPEVYAPSLTENTRLLAEVRKRVTDGLVTWAECGGLIFLSKSIDGSRLCGAIPTLAHMTDRVTIGYRHAAVRVANPVAPLGAQLAGHEFHYSKVVPSGDALELTGRLGGGLGGFASPTLLASYLHCHLGATPEPAERFIATAVARLDRAPARPR